MIDYVKITTGYKQKLKGIKAINQDPTIKITRIVKAYISFYTPL